MGDNAIPIPKELVNKILKVEFIEMYELLPENWPHIIAEGPGREDIARLLQFLVLSFRSLFSHCLTVQQCQQHRALPLVQLGR